MQLSNLVATSQDSVPLVRVAIFRTQTGVDCETQLFGIRKRELSPSQDGWEFSVESLLTHLNNVWPGIVEGLKMAGFGDEKIAQIRSEIEWDINPSKPAEPDQTTIKSLV